MHDDDCFSFGSELLQECDDCAFCRRVNTLKRFIHQIDGGILHERAGEKDALLLSTGELADLPVGVCLHPHFLQCVHREFTFRLPRSAEPA